MRHAPWLNEKLRIGRRAALSVLVVLVVLVVPALEQRDLHAAMTELGSGGSAGMSVAPPAPELPQRLPGQLSSKFPIDRRNPEASVPGTKERDADPLEYGYLIQDLLTEAEAAKQRHDDQMVVLYYRAVAKAVPDNAKGWSKLCEAYEVVNDRDRAIRACQYALERPAVELQDYVRYVRLHLGKPDDLTAVERGRVHKVLMHLDQQPALALVTAQLQCELGVKQREAELLQTCTRTLMKLAPDDPRTIVFQWNLAVQTGQPALARQLVERAGRAGVVVSNIERMQRVTESLGGAWRGRTRLGMVGLAGILLVTLAWFLWRRGRVAQELAR